MNDELENIHQPEGVPAQEMRHFISGISLLELLMGLTLSVFLILASFKIFMIVRNHFLTLKADQEISLAAASALDKIGSDLRVSGIGLVQPILLGVLDGIAEDEAVLSITSGGGDYSFLADITPGQSHIRLESPQDFKVGGRICIYDATSAEVKTISYMDGQGVGVSSPFTFTYDCTESSLVLLREVAIFFDDPKQVLRRKVNRSSAQPLCEGVAAFDFSYDQTANLVTVKLNMEARKEKDYEISIFPNNLALAR